MDLLKPNQLALLQSLGLVRSKPVVIESGVSNRIYLSKVPHSLRKAAKKAHFQETVFHFPNIRCLDSFLANRKRYAPNMRKIGIDNPENNNFAALARLLERLPALEELTIGIDEAKLLQCAFYEHHGHLWESMRPQDIGYQLNLGVLRVQGIDSLRRVYVPKVKFTPYQHGTIDPQIKRVTGPIPGGVFENVIGPDMMCPLPINHKGEAVPTTRIDKRDKYHIDIQIIPPDRASFRFLDLPPEIRNKIYHFLLEQNGAVNPSTRVPTSCYFHGKIMDVPTPRSVLTLLQSNRQIHDEAVGIFYAQNHFVFYYPLQLMNFLHDLSEKRKGYLENVTVWYKNTRQGGMSLFDYCLRKLNSLPGLKQLEIILDERTAIDLPTMSAVGPNEALLKVLSQKGVNVSIRCQWADTVIWQTNDDGSGDPGAAENEDWQIMCARDAQSGSRYSEDRIKVKTT